MLSIVNYSTGPISPMASDHQELNGSSKSECYQAGDEIDQQQQQLYVNLSTFWYCFLALITTVGLLISLISNMIIIYLFTSTPFLRKNPSNIVAVNLSLSDLLYCIQWPSVIYCSLTQSTWILEYTFVCQSFGFITVSTALASILTVLAMSIERAIVILYSIHARNKFTIRLAWMITVLIWLLALSSCLPPLFGKFNRYTLDPSKTSCTRKSSPTIHHLSSRQSATTMTHLTNKRFAYGPVDYVSRHANYKLYILVLYVAYWIVPAILITISYITIIVTFMKSSLDLKKISGEVYASSTSISAIRGHQLGRKLGNSLRLNESSKSNPEQPSRKFIESCYERRASTSVVDLSNYFVPPMSRSPATDLTGNGSVGALTGRRKVFKRVVSNSALPVCSNYDQQIVATHSRPRTNCFVDEMSSPAGSQLRVDRNLNSEPDRWRSQQNRSVAGSSLVRPKIIKTLSNLKSMPQQAANSQLTRTVLQFRLAKMSFYLILLWLVSWTPIASLAMLNSVMRCPRVSATAVFLASTMTKLGPALDVFIYGISHPKIKSRFKQIIRNLLFLNGSSYPRCTRSYSAR